MVISMGAGGCVMFVASGVGWLCVLCRCHLLMAIFLFKDGFAS